MVLIKDQGKIIDSIKTSNNKLLDDLNNMEKDYNQIRGVINSKFKETSDYLTSIKDKVGSLTTVQIPIE